jgi:inositol phosphorylceramide mannosyltransferase catalytic subunit
MARPYRRNVLRAVALLTLALGSFSVLHQLSYLVDVVAHDPLPRSIQIIAKCHLSNRQNTGKPSVQTSPKIPNLVHQIWKTSDVSTYPLEASYNSWKFFFEPLNYTVKLWTDEDIRILIHREYPWLLHTYESYSHNVQRADIARLVVMHAEGGVYADLDVYPVSKHWVIKDGLMCMQRLGIQAVFPPMAGNSGMSNHFFMAEKGSRFLEAALQEATRRDGRSKRIVSPYLQVFWSTGPLMITAAAHQFLQTSSPAEQSQLLTVMDRKFTRSLIFHKAGRSWHGWDGHALNWIADNVDEVHCIIILGFLIGISIGGWLIICRRRNGSD